MEHADQHREAIARTIRVRNEVTAEVFDDKVRPMGTVTVANGRIEIKLDSLPSTVSLPATGAFLVESIALAIEACWRERNEAFEPHRL